MAGTDRRVRKRGKASARLLAAAAGLVLLLPTSILARPAPQTAEDRQPRNIFELIYSFDHTFSRILDPADYDEYRAWGPESMRRADPALYDRISKDIRSWTTLWIHYVRTSLVPIPQKRLEKAQQMADQVDGILKTHFEAKGWPYKTLRAVFLPPQVFLDERHREMLTSGMFVPFYPDAFFVSVDWPVPMQLVLVHESLHFNRIGASFGPELAEGITETGARYLVLKYQLLTPHAINQEKAYPRERKGVEFVLDEAIKRTAMNRDAAVELFLEAYVTGRQDGMIKVFGAETWDRVLKLSQSPGAWQTHRIKEALEK